MYSLPSEFIERIRIQFPEDGEALLAALDEQAGTSIHIHSIKGKNISHDGQPVRWYSQGKILNSRPSFTLDPLFHAGCYYPQESSSMFLYYVLECLYGDKRNITCLDLCAAPGGKSLLISSFLGNEGRLISNEIIRSRNSILRENLIKWGADNALITCNESSDFSKLKQYFNCVITDAPCSGEGMFRKDRQSRNEWSPNNVKFCAGRQKRILEEIAPAVKEGGYLIYSTCTFSHDENDAQVANLLATGRFEEIEIPLQPEWNITRTKHGLQFFPHKVPGEGFYISVLRKISTGEPQFKAKGKPVFQAVNKSEESKIFSYTNTEERNLIKTAQDTIYASAFSITEMNQLATQLYFTMPGVEMGDFIKDELVPAHSLALSPFQLHKTQNIEVDKETALQYLRGESLQLKGEKGITLISYKGMPLGWAKVLGNRTNNYYPKEWRIRIR